MADMEYHVEIVLKYNHERVVQINILRWKQFEALLNAIDKNKLALESETKALKETLSKAKWVKKTFPGVLTNGQ